MYLLLNVTLAVTIFILVVDRCLLNGSGDRITCCLYHTFQSTCDCRRLEEWLDDWGGSGGGGGGGIDQ